MPVLSSKKEGMIPSNTWDTFVELGIKEKHAGNARTKLRGIMELTSTKIPNIVMLRQGQEQWTGNLFTEPVNEIARPYKTKMEIRIYAQNAFRAKQELAKMIALWTNIAKEYSIYRIYRFGKDWSDE